MKKLLLILLCFSSCTVIKTVSDSVDKQEFKMIAKKNNKVFISSNDKFISEKIVNYTKREIEEWGYWIVTSVEKEADFILEIDIIQIQAVSVIEISAEFINKNNQKAFYSIKVEPWGSNLIFNTTKWSVEKIIHTRIKPFVESLN